MTKPMRRALLNAEISREARRIAHWHTRTCTSETLPNENDYHTAKCNQLKEQIEQLVLTVKLAEKQPSERPEPPPFELTPEQTQPADPTQPHDYFPDYMHMGDCVVCGNVREHPLHAEDA